MFENVEVSQLSSERFYQQLCSEQADMNTTEWRFKIWLRSQ